MALVAVALLATLPHSASLRTSIPPTPSAPTASSVVLPAGLQAAISATLGKAYRIASGPGGALEARNPRQDLEARFSAKGIGVRPSQGQWSFDLSVARYGREGQLFSVRTAQPLAQGARVEYPREAFTEWYENRPQGVEQGFTLPSPPPGAGLVELELRRSETLSADLAPDARSVLLSDSAGTLVLRYQDLLAYDAGLQALSVRMALGPGTIRLLVDDRGATYPITIDPLVVTQRAHLFASDGAVSDGFGISAALAGDTALVGAYADATAGGASAGSAYVFVRSGTTWTEQAHLFASDGAAGDQFGFSVALVGDTALVGARFDDTAGGGSAGSAYVFVRSGTSWTEQAHLFASDGALNDAFGRSVALAGDTALVGAVFDDTAGGGNNAGSAYVFVRSGTTWTEEAHLFASDGTVSDGFGISAALAGDTALVGASGDDTAGGSSAGSAYVFVRSGTTWTEQAHLFASDGAVDDRFGCSVALAGDTALVGACEDDTAGGSNAGSAYAFVRNGTTWTEQAHLFASDGAAGDNFGVSVALASDTALVGADLDTTAAGAGAGSAYLFVRSGTTWTEQAHLFASDGAAGDNFGVSVALAGNTALVGASEDDAAGRADAGSAYVFVISAAPPVLCKGSAATIVGTAASNTLNGTAARDIIAGLGGNDVINGRGGNDLICAGPGNDTVSGGAGKDRLLGEGGKDRLKGGPARDRIEGGSGNDKLSGGSGKDTCKGGSGRDTATGCERVSGVP